MQAPVAFILPVGNKGREETVRVTNTESLKRGINCRTCYSSMQVRREKYALPVKVKMRRLKGLVHSHTRQDSASILPFSSSDPWKYRQISQERQIQMS